MVRTALVAAAFALAGCDRIESVADQADWAESQAAQNALTIERLNAQNEVMSNRIADLENEVRRLRAVDVRDLNSAVTDMKTINSEINRLTENDKAFIAQIDYLRALHGRGPMPSK